MSDPSVSATPPPHVVGVSAQRQALRRVVRRPVAVVCIVVMLIVAAVTVLAPVLTPYDPTVGDPSNILGGPSASNWLGTDGSGRDILSRLIEGARLSVVGAVVVVLTAIVIGVPSGMLAGYYDRRLRKGMSWVASLLQALPGMVILLSVTTIFGTSLWPIFVTFGILLSPAYYWVVYGVVRTVSQELFIDAARVSGLPDWRIIARHLLAVVAGPTLVLSSQVAGAAIGVVAGLSFIGVGDPSSVSWGGMLNDAFVNIYRAPYQLIAPAALITICCVVLTLFANIVRDELQGAGPTGSSRRRATRANGQERSVSVAETVSDALLQIRDLSVGYEQAGGSWKVVVSDVSMTVARGEVHGLIGESGSGKTQTAFAVLGLLGAGGAVLSGSISFEGVDLSSLDSRELAKIRGRKIGYVPQEPMSNLDPSFTIGSQIAEPIRINLRVSRAEARRRSLALLARVGFEQPERVYRLYPHQVSGGMAQRALIAAAVCCHPDLLIADEPTTALDVTVQAEVLHLLRELCAELNMAVLLVTHNLGVVADICDRVSVMKEGMIVENGDVRDVFANPRDPYTRSLFAARLEDPVIQPEWLSGDYSVQLERSRS